MSLEISTLNFFLKEEPLGQAGYMKGNGYVELNRSAFVDGGPSQSSISFGLRFSTTKSKGLLFWFGQKRLETSNQQDFIALYIEDGHLVYAFRLNGNEHRLSTTIAINDGQQCYVFVKQIGNEGSIELPDYNYHLSGHSDPINKDARINLPGNVFLGITLTYITPKQANEKSYFCFFFGKKVEHLLYLNLQVVDL